MICTPCGKGKSSSTKTHLGKRRRFQEGNSNNTVLLIILSSFERTAIHGVRTIYILYITLINVTLQNQDTLPFQNKENNTETLQWQRHVRDTGESCKHKHALQLL